MATTYTGTDAVKAVADQGLLSQAIVNALNKFEQINNLDVTSTGDITKGTNVAFFAETTSGTIDLHDLSPATVKGLKALIFSTGNGIDLSLGNQFKGAVTLGGGDDTADAHTSGKALYLNAGAGNDSVTSGSGQDTVVAGDGNDTVVTGNGKDFVNGGTGDDSVSTGNGNDTVVTGTGSDTVDTGAGTDVIIVRNNDGNTVVDGGKGLDVMDLTGAGHITEIMQGATPKEVMFHFENGSTLTVSNVEKFIGDFGGDGTVVTIGLNHIGDWYTG